MSNYTYFLPTAPARIMHEIWRETEEISGLFLAHDVFDNQDAYKRLMHARHDIDASRRFIILDNSANELGAAISDDIMLECCEILHPDVVVLPDVLFDSTATVERSYEAYMKWSKKLSMPALMFLPQGKNFNDWLQCLEQARSLMPLLKYIGIPRNTVNAWNANREVLAQLVHIYFPRAIIHLFGMSQHMHEDILAARSPLVKSIDSTYPLRAERFRLSTVERRKDEWFTEAQYAHYMSQNVLTVRNMLNVV